MNEHELQGPAPPRTTLPEWMMVAGCFVFGCALILNVHAAGDGGWFWYASLLLQGKHLYRDLHLALQPLFVLETAGSLALLGKGWLIGKLPAALTLVAYVYALLLVVREARLPAMSRALVLGCAFFVSVSVEAFRPDDYHVLADCFELYSLVLLLRMHAVEGRGATLWRAGLLGVLCGLSLMTRLNDGAALLVGVTIGLLYLARVRRVVSVLICWAAATAMGLLVVLATGDSLHDYAMYSILRAAGSKGGAGSVLTYPFVLPWRAFHYASASLAPLIVLLASVAVCVAAVFLVWPLRRRRGLVDVLKALAGVGFIWFVGSHLYDVFVGESYMIAMSSFGVLAAYGLGVMVVVRRLRTAVDVGYAAKKHALEVLLLIPLGQLASASMSSGGIHAGLYAPLGVMILLLPLASPVEVRRRQPRQVLVALAGLMIVYGVVYKTRIPYSWHSYRQGALFTGRVWYRHPEYGTMLIDRQQLEMMQQVCAEVKTGSAQMELLSLPFSYANYFCETPPWHDYVQTFFDTSSKETIDGLAEELKAAPPRWIFYQRQLDSMTIHEELYNQRRPLPHRALDALIEQRIGDGSWQAVYRSNFGDRPGWSNEWILVRTIP